MTKYSIWIELPSDLYERLAKIVDSLAIKYQGPKLQPHFTLISEIDSNDIDVCREIKKLTQETTPFKCQTADIGFSTTYFQSVFLRIKPNFKLLNFNLEAKKLFNLSPNVYMPHVSLFYGGKSMYLRENIARKVSFEPESFFAKKLTVIKYDDQNLDPNSWKRIAEFELSSHKAERI
jgi:2'-5' RNA ligase